MREAFESESRATGKDRLLVTMAVPASLEYAGKVGNIIVDKLNLGQKHLNYGTNVSWYKFLCCYCNLCYYCNNQTS